jgi:hypothetical protein
MFSEQVELQRDVGVTFSLDGLVVVVSRITLLDEAESTSF